MDESHIINILSADIQKKRELTGLDESIVKSQLKAYFEKNKKTLSRLAQYQNEKQLTRSADYEKVLKSIRAKLYESYGMFQIPKNSESIKQDFLRKVNSRNANEDDFKNALSLHLSTKERFENYSLIYENIFKIAGKPRVILDLGCGLNPLSAHYLGLNKFRYIASDIDKSNLMFIDEFFKLSGIDGRTVLLDLTNSSDLQKLAFIESDICFMLKLLEVDKRIAEEIITSVNAKYIVASFSTINLQGRIMSNPEREWLEKLLKRLKMKFSTFKTENEIFYVIRKS